jgi:hypothetical protein
MEDIETMIDTMIRLYRLKLNDTAMRFGFTAPETVTCSQELDKWILLAIGKRHHKQPYIIKRQTGRASAWGTDYEIDLIKVLEGEGVHEFIS